MIYGFAGWGLSFGSGVILFLALRKIMVGIFKDNCDWVEWLLGLR